METTAVKIEKGHFLWHELLTTDTDAAIDFYSHVVGWKTQPYEIHGQQEMPPYTMFMAGEIPVGGIMAIDKQTMGDVPPNWTAYISTPDVDASVSQVKELGGKVLMEAMDVPTVGRMAVVADPQGAAFGLYTPSGEPMDEAWPPPVQTFSWNELATTDWSAAYDFYQKVFGWEKQDEMDMGDGWIYQMYGQKDRMYGGIYNKPPEMPAPPHWLFYVKVDDLDAALERVKERGGQVLNGPMEVPGGDRVATCMDPQGAAFALHEVKK